MFTLQYSKKFGLTIPYLIGIGSETTILRASPLSVRFLWMNGELSEAPDESWNSFVES